jgi:LPPG:FO 2-phospho-L-lactate transferase
MRSLGLEVSAFSVAKLYEDFLDIFVIDARDIDEKSKVEQLGIEVKVTDTMMKSLEDKIRLAKAVLET